MFLRGEQTCFQRLQGYWSVYPTKSKSCVWNVCFICKIPVPVFICYLLQTTIDCKITYAMFILWDQIAMPSEVCKLKFENQQHKLSEIIRKTWQLLFSYTSWCSNPAVPSGKLEHKGSSWQVDKQVCFCLRNICKDQKTKREGQSRTGFYGLSYHSFMTATFFYMRTDTFYIF